MMADLLDYFEARSHTLDKVEVNHSLCSLDNKFTSCITFNGVPILPPVMTQRRRDEMAGYRRQAVQRETRRRSKQREQLVAKVQSIVAEVEKEFSLKCRSRLPRTAGISRLLEKRASRGMSDSSCSSPVGSDVSSTTSSRISSTNHVKHPSIDKNRQSSIHQNKHDQSEQTLSKVIKHDRSTVEKQSQVKESANVSKDNKQRASDLQSNSKKRSTTDQQIPYSNSEKSKTQSSKNRTGDTKTETKSSKSASSSNKVEQKTSQIPKPIPKQNNNPLSNLKRASSMSSLPNLAKIEGLPIPKPPASPKTKQQLRRARLAMSGQYSISQPDLREIDKSDSETSISSHSQMDESPSHRRKQLLQSSQHSVSNPDLVSAGLSPEKNLQISEQQMGKKSPKTKLSSSKSVPNLTHIGRTKKRKSHSETGKRITESSEDPENHQVAKSNLNDKDVGEKEGGLESLSDLTSLDNCNSLPQEFAGMPLSSVRQQQISHVLAKLSQCLNIQDTTSTLNSTGSSGQDAADIRQQITDQILESAGLKPGSIQAQQFLNQGFIPNIKNKTADTHNVTPSDESSSLSNVQTPPSQNSSRISSEPMSSGSADNRTQTSIASNSIMSSGGSVSGNQPVRRLSPKGLKSNKVHFSSFLTEISTSASQSLEGRISVRKMDITPQSSPRVSLDTTDGAQPVETQEKLKLKIVPKNSNDLGFNSEPQVFSSDQPDSMLSKVALSPETSESSPGTPKDIFNKGIPFHGYGGDLDNSDKENEFMGKQLVGTSEGFVQSRISAMSQNGAFSQDVKSQGSEEGSQCSTLKASQDLLKSKDSNVGSQKTSSTTGSREMYDSNSTDWEKYLRGMNSIHESAQQTAQSRDPIMSSNVSIHSQKYSQNGLQCPQTRPNKNTSENEVNRQSVHTSVFQGPVRKDARLLQQPSPALMQATSDDFMASNGMSNGGTTGSVHRKLNMDAATEHIKPETSPHVRPAEYGSQLHNISLDTSTEQEGKAEHIQRYLSHVQNLSHQNSPPRNIPNQLNGKGFGTPADVASAIQSFTSTLESLENMSEEELLRIQAEHFDKIRRFLVEQQKQQLEELFVHQRREQMELQSEIESYQNQMKQQELLQHSPENNAAYPTHPNQQVFDISGISHHDNQTAPVGCHQTLPKQYAYVSSPSLYFNPKDRDNNSDISTFSKATPKQSLQFVNHSTPSPKIYKPVVRSPVKQPSLPKYNSRPVIPDKVFDPDMKRCFDRVSACVKGYLTRRLLKTEKVQEIIKTIQDTKQFAYSFQAETPIKRGMFSNQDKDLLDRIIAQLQAALLDIHEIFFEIPVWERMSLIAHSRQLMQEKRLRDSTNSRSSLSNSQPRISSATLKAMERKRKAQEAEEIGNIRPQSAPSGLENSRTTNNNQSIDFSGPLRRHFQFLLSRALKPIQGQTAGQNPTREKTRPKTSVVLSKPVPLTTGQKAKKPVASVASGKTSTKTSSTTNKVKTTVKPKTKPASAWR